MLSRAESNCKYLSTIEVVYVFQMVEKLSKRKCKCKNAAKRHGAFEKGK